MTSTRSVTIAPTDTITADITCRRCGYNLRGLSDAGLCPECGTAVGLSTQGDLLRYADPRWLGKLRIGLWLMFAGAMCLIVMRLQNMVLPLRMPFVVQPFVYFGFALISIAGIWLLTMPDPAGLAEDQYVTARKVIRITVIIGLAYWVVALGMNTRTLSPDLQMTMRALALVFGLAGIIGEAAKFKYLGQLSARVPRNGLTKFARFMMWCAPIVNAWNLVIIALLTFRGLPRISSGLSLFLSAQTLASLIVLILSVSLYARMAVVVRQQHRSAQETWAAAKGEQPA